MEGVYCSSTNPGWELNPGHLFRYHTSGQPGSHRYCQYSLHEHISECLYAWKPFTAENWVLLLIKRQCMQFSQTILPCDYNSEMCQILISLSGDPSKLTLSKTKYIWQISKSGINSKEVKSSDLKIYYSLDPKT